MRSCGATYDAVANWRNKTMTKKQMLHTARLALGGAILGIALGHLIGLHSMLAVGAEVADLVSASLGGVVAAVTVVKNHLA